MKKIFKLTKEKMNTCNHLLIFLLTITFLISCKKDSQGKPGDDHINPDYSYADTLQKTMNKYVKEGLPGISLTVYTAKEGWWQGAAGYAKIETKTSMKPEHLQYLQSIAKTYMAVAILKLWENGKINLDSSVTKYLPNPYSDYITGAEKITVRHLLNHTSGIHDYADDPDYVAYLIENPYQKLSTQQLLKYIEGKSSRFTPGSQFQYCNTNYELLAIIADTLTGDHAKFIHQNIIQPLNLSQTFYRFDKNYLNYSNLVDSYLDQSGSGNVANVSQWQKVNVANMIGDDGIVATPMDAVKLLKGIFEGKLLSQAAINEMTNWVKDEDGMPVYGCGLYNVHYKSVTAYGHGGSGIGSGCGLYYFPTKNVYVFYGSNLGTIVEGPLVAKALEFRGQLLDIILK